MAGHQEFQPLVQNALVSLPDGRVWESGQHWWARFHKHMGSYGGFPICTELRSARQQEGVDAFLAVDDNRALAPDEVASTAQCEEVAEELAYKLLCSLCFVISVIGEVIMPPNLEVTI